MFRHILPSLVLLSVVQAQSTTPSGNYTPSFVPCPTNVSLVRPASEGLSSAEKTWLQKRTPNVVSALETYLELVGIPGFNTSDYIAALQNKESATPVMGLTLSGGGNVGHLHFSPEQTAIKICIARNVDRSGDVSSTRRQVPGRRRSEDGWDIAGYDLHFRPLVPNAFHVL